jgi:hypothetical protein
VSGDQASCAALRSGTRARVCIYVHAHIDLNRRANAGKKGPVGSGTVTFVCARVCARVRACTRACACVCACAHGCVRACAYLPVHNVCACVRARVSGAQTIKMLNDPSISNFLLSAKIALARRPWLILAGMFLGLFTWSTYIVRVSEVHTSIPIDQEMCRFNL